MLTGGISSRRNLILPEHALHSDLKGDITFMTTNFQFRKVFKMSLFDFNLDYNLTSKRKAVLSNKYIYFINVSPYTYVGYHLSVVADCIDYYLKLHVIHCDILNFNSVLHTYEIHINE